MASRSIISTVCYQSTERSKYSNCTVNPGQTRIFYKAGQTRMTRPGFNPDGLRNVGYASVKNNNNNNNN